LEAWILVQEGRWAEAEKMFRRHCQKQPRDPFGAFWLGRLLEKRGARVGARREYERALREDGSRVHEINDRIRRIVGEEDAVLADVENIFKNASPGPRNNDIVYDAMHWNRFADPLVSLTIAQALGDASLPGLRDVFSPKPLPALWSAFKRLKPTDQERAAIFRKKALGAIWDSFLGRGFFSEGSVGTLESLCRDQPRRFKDLLHRKGDLSGHLGPWTESQREEWDSRWAFGLAHVGEAYRRLGFYREALVYFAEARRYGCSWPIVQAHRAFAQKALGGKGKSVRELVFETYGRQ
jgi:tetratricopeptide (TPR) repeat protein